jgi:hypothetical protein
MIRFGLIAVSWLAGGAAMAGEIDGACAISPVAKAVGSIRVTVDPRVEVMSVIQTVGGYRELYPVLLARESSTYRQHVEQVFSKYASRRAVAMVTDLSRGGFNFSRPPFVMLHLDESLRMRRDIVPDALAVKLSGGEDNIAELAREIAGFCKQSGFAAFYEEHREFYMSLVDQAARSLAARDYIRDVETFYGARQKAYTLVLVPLYGHVGYGPHLTLKDGSHEVFNILGPLDVKDGVQNFAYGTSYFEDMQRHEFSHSFVNPLATENHAEVEKLSPLFQRMPEAARNNVCGDWEECLNEQVVRAVTTYLAYSDSQSAGDRALAAEKRHGAVLIDELLAGVREYASSRDRYPAFESYYPMLLRRLEALLQ